MSACSFVSSAVLDETQPLIEDVEERRIVEEDIHIIESSLHFINDLLRNMLDMHRAKTNQLQIETEPTHILNDVLKPVDCMLHKRGSSFKVLVECCDQTQDAVILADKLRLKQIMLNLARNSLKFVEKGFIRLRCQLTSDGMVQLSVEDSGPGVPQHKKEQLFRRFQKSLDSLHQGTGIGLSLCKQLSELMGAQLYIDDTYDSGIPGCPGARFVLKLNVLPIVWTDEMLDEYSKAYTNLFNSGSTGGHSGVTATTRSSSPSSDQNYSHSSNNDANELPEQKEQKQPHQDTGDNSKFTELPSELNVLFVDDDMVLRKLFCRSVRKICPGWTLKEASSGEASLSMCEEESFDIIFMDQYMASVQKQLLGTETTRALRAQGVTSRICGLSANDVEEAFFEAGADTFMIKPFPCKADPLTSELLRVLNDGKIPLFSGTSLYKANATTVTLSSSTATKDGIPLKSVTSLFAPLSDPSAKKILSQTPPSQHTNASKSGLFTPEASISESSIKSVPNLFAPKPPQENQPVPSLFTPLPNTDTTEAKSVPNLFTMTETLPPNEDKPVPSRFVSLSSARNSSTNKSVPHLFTAIPHLQAATTNVSTPNLFTPMAMDPPGHTVPDNYTTTHISPTSSPRKRISMAGDVV